LGSRRPADREGKKRRVGEGGNSLSSFYSQRGREGPVTRAGEGRGKETSLPITLKKVGVEERRRGVI